MFYDITQAVKACEEDPLLIFEAIKEGHFDLVDQLLTKKQVPLNTVDLHGDDVLSNLLKYGQYELVLKFMKNKDWDINHQNNDGDTFAHILVSIDYKKVASIIQKLKKRTDFLPNIKNNKGETILDKSINDHYIYTTVKVLEDERFNNIDILSFKNLYDTYIKTNNYGKYSRLSNLEIIVDNLEDKKLVPSMEKIIKFIQTNFDAVKEEIFNNKKGTMDEMINTLLKEHV